jgi:hypothetical protein
MKILPSENGEFTINKKFFLNKNNFQKNLLTTRNLPRAWGKY